MVAVAHDEQQPVLIAERIEFLRDSFAVLHEISLRVTAFHIQIEIVQQREIFTLRFQIFQDDIFGVVVQYHYMRQLVKRVLAYLQAGRYAFDDRRLGGADRRGVPLLIGIAFEIERENDAEPRRRKICRALHEHKARGQFFEHVLRTVFPHGGKDCRASFITVAFQIQFGKDQTERRWLFADRSVQFFPIFFIRGMLVAGDDRPRGHVFHIRQ